jgi:hypothetical protein
MTAIANLLDPEEVRKLKGLVLIPRPEPVDLVDSECNDCHQPIKVHQVSIPGAISVCVPCAKKRTKGTSFTYVERPKEQPVPQIDLNAIPAATLGEALREGIVTLVAEQAPAKRKKAKDKKDRDRAIAKTNLTNEQERRTEATPLAEFKVGATLVVPALDLTDKDLNSLATAKDRSPYNKARYRLGHEEVLDKETTTYAVLAAEHVRLAKLAKTHKEKPVQQIAAKVEPEAPAKLTKKQMIQALMDEGGFTKAEAKALLAEAGL